MGRLIDADTLKDNIVIPDPSYILSSDMYRINQLKKWIDAQPTVEAIPKDQYETRLKADLTAILEEFDLRLREKIDALKGEQDGKNEF